MSLPLSNPIDPEKGLRTDTTDTEGSRPSSGGSLMPLLRNSFSYFTRTPNPPDAASTPSRVRFPRLWQSSKDKKEPPPRSEIIVQKLQECHKGYPRLAAFQASDESFLLYRRFGYLQARVLLDKQDHLRELEEELSDLDGELFSARETYPETRTAIFDKSLRERRADLMTRIENTYCSYSSLMVAAQQMISMNRPAESAFRSVDSFSMEEALADVENTWIGNKEDLLTLKPGREHSWLDDGIEHILRWFHCPAIEYVFCSEETKQKTEGRDGSEVYYTRSRIEKLVNSIILFVILALLIVPIWLLYFFVTSMGNGKADAPCMGVLLVATLAFSAVLAIFTRAKRHEILAAAAAYCAVLVVFLGNVPQLLQDQRP